MSRECDLQNIFNQLQKIPGLIGDAMEFARVAMRYRKEELAQILRQEYAWNYATEEKIGQIEDGATTISFESFQDICAALGYGMEKMLKVANHIADSRKKTDQELFKETADELHYQHWAQQQRDQP